jgi:hypothetical protein
MRKVSPRRATSRFSARVLRIAKSIAGASGAEIDLLQKAKLLLPALPPTHLGNLIKTFALFHAMLHFLQLVGQSN